MTILESREKNLVGPAVKLSQLSEFLLTKDRQGHLGIRETHKRLSPAFTFSVLSHYVECSTSGGEKNQTFRRRDKTQSEKGLS